MENGNWKMIVAWYFKEFIRTSNYYKVWVRKLWIWQSGKECLQHRENNIQVWDNKEGHVYSKYNNMHEAFVQNSRTTYVIWAKFRLKLSKLWKINGRKTPWSLNFLRIKDQGLSFKGPTFELCCRCTLMSLLTLCYNFFDFYISWLPKGGFLMLLVIRGHLAASSSMDMLWVLLSSSAVY